MDLFNYSRRRTHEVRVGPVIIGGSQPIRLQSMTNTPTLDTDACVEQALRIVERGGEIVRLTTQGMREAENLKHISAALRRQGCPVPLVADVHFNPAVADVAANYADKVRINPGNYVDPARTFKRLTYTDEEYALEIEKIRAQFVPFLSKCKACGTAVRIGVNHGSLSDRIMSRYGDTPEGMVESCMEFLRICVDQAFRDVVISIKASNTVVMVRTVRLLVATMEREGMDFPLHLGVTEAGEGEDGRIKSALGIGALLADGLGDTIRVSLSEPPEDEIPVARKLVDYIASHAGGQWVEAKPAAGFDYLAPQRRETAAVEHVGGGQVPVVVDIRSRWDGAGEYAGQCPDYLYVHGIRRAEDVPETVGDIPVVFDYRAWTGRASTYPSFPAALACDMDRCDSPVKFLVDHGPGLDDGVADCLRRHPEAVVLLFADMDHGPGRTRAYVHRLMTRGLLNPVVVCRQYSLTDIEDLQIRSAADMGPLLFDGLADGIGLECTDAGHAGSDSTQATLRPAQVVATAFGILQAARLRTTRTEFISCPGCGRTLYDLQSTIARIREATAHLRGLKIAIMGCIVNGPGEMADADYGYVGAGRGKVSLYRRRECVERNIPESQAVDKLVELIKQHGNWRD